VIRRWQFWVAFSLAIFAVDLGLWVRWVVRELPDPTPLREPAWVQQHFGLEAWTPLSAVPPLALRVILISEDDTFFHNSGLRLDEIGAAAWDDLLAGRYKRGASSITQQVVRNAFLSKDKTLSRKLREMLLARRADELVGKRRLLEAYLNLAQWGPKERGIGWASRRYFGKPVEALNAVEGAYLAWLLPDPIHRSIAARRGELTPQARRHIKILIGRLAREGSLSDDEEAALLAQPWSLGGLAQAPLKP
jgi:monofunctional biosynthetic peptidoglycan transglycosylase